MPQKYGFTKSIAVAKQIPWEKSCVWKNFVSLGFLLVWVVPLVGCGDSRASLHEHEHETPMHWPHDLKDAARKIRERSAVLDSDESSAYEQAFAELRDLIEWTPEVAADGDLSEQQWMPLYKESERLRQELHDPKIKPAIAAEQLKAFCELLEKSGGN
jgi:hypothetical protein